MLANGSKAGACEIADKAGIISVAGAGDSNPSPGCPGQPVFDLMF